MAEKGKPCTVEIALTEEIREQILRARGGGDIETVPKTMTVVRVSHTALGLNDPPLALLAFDA